MKGVSTAVKVGLVVLVVVAVGYGAFMQVSERASGTDSVTYWALFNDASGFADKSRVVIAGLTVGEIADMRLQGNQARVTVRVRRGVPIYTTATIFKKSSSLLGEYYIEIQPGFSEVPGPDGKMMANELLPDGGQIKNVREATTAGDVMDQIGRVMPRVDEVLVEIRGLAADARKILNTNIANIARNVDKLVEEDAKVIDSILRRVDRIAEDIEDITGTSGDEVKRILGSVERSAYELEALLKSARGEVELTGKDIRDRLARLDRSIAALEETLEGTASIAKKIDDPDSGTLSRLVNDPTIADNVEQVTEDIKGFTSGLFSIQTLVGIRSEFNLFAQLSRETVWIELHTKPDKYYLFEVVSDTRGSIEQTYEVDVAGQLVRSQTIEPYGLRVSFMFAKKIGWATFRVGVKESTGGGGFDASLFGGRGKLSLDVFDFQFDRFPRVRVTTAWNFFRYLYLYAGVDDVLNKYQEIPVVGDNVSGGGPEVFPFGRDVFVGAGLSFSDDDLRTLLFIGGGAIAALAGN